MALTWAAPSPPLASNDDRVSMTQASCGPFRARCYAIESGPQDRFFFDVEFVNAVGASAVYVVKSSGDPKITGTLDTPAKAQRAAALRLQSIAAKMTSTLGVVK